MLQKRHLIFVILGFLCLVFPIASHAQATLTPDTTTIAKARVTKITNQQQTVLPGNDVPSPKQTITADILSGAESGTSVTFDNEYIQLKVGDLFYLRHITSTLDAGTDYYTVSDPYRLNVLGGLVAVFIILIIIFGGMQGVRGFASLCGSFILLFYVLIPSILAGYSPVLVSTGVASLIIIVGSYITHGFNRTTTAAVLGMIGTVLVTGLGAYYVVHAAHLTGYNGEESVYINFATQGHVDLIGLLFGGIMIGLLGVLYDIAIGQAIVVEELLRAGTNMTRLQVYERAIRIGREHIGALVNTLAIAYVGAALPLLLVVHNSTFGIAYAINNEIFATEVVRILSGSIGLILGVPITTLIASYILTRTRTAVVTHEERSHHH